jgi:hypothetical protein
LSNYTSNWWLRQGDLNYLSQRVVYDDSVTVMQSVSPDCHTVKAEIQPNDTETLAGQQAQRAQVRLADIDSGQASLGMSTGITRWYGFAFTTNPGYVPQYAQYSGDWNIIYSSHNLPINGVYGPQAPIALAVTTEAAASGASDWTSNTNMMHLATPRLELQVNGGNQDDPDWWIKDGNGNTMHRYLGPVFTPGHLYRVQFKVTWGAHMNGAIQLWIDGVKYVDVAGICNLWYSGTTDGVNYALFENYRKYDTSLPINDVYYGGLLTGTTQADVTVP